MKNDNDIPLIRAALRYDAHTGVVRWLRATAPHVKAGDRAGTLMNQGYRIIKIMGHQYQTSHIAFALTTGRWPAAQIDHKNCDRSDDRWLNLREATNAQNCRNRKRLRTNRSGHKGVDWYPKYGKWRSRITLDARTIHLGYFESLEEAVAAYDHAAPALHGEFYRNS